MAKCRVSFPTNPPCSTDTDICEEGNVPILMSLPQMRNLNLEMSLSPDAVSLTGAAFGYNHTPAVMATSQHIVMNLAELKINSLLDTNYCFGAFLLGIGSGAISFGQR